MDFPKIRKRAYRRDRRAKKRREANAERRRKIRLAVVIVVTLALAALLYLRVIGVLFYLLPLRFERLRDDGHPRRGVETPTENLSSQSAIGQKKTMQASPAG